MTSSSAWMVCSTRRPENNTGTGKIAMEDAEYDVDEEDVEKDAAKHIS